jgi:Asp-tRNA(Asn)/Glu-tRNA(Gln) amidotransferase C subunit
VDDAMVQELARLAELKLSPERRKAVVDTLGPLLESANRVNRFMDARTAVPPAVSFGHPQLHEDPAP